MPTLTWPEIRNRATEFAREWKDATSERAEAQTFWNEFFHIFGVQRRSVAVYEKQVAKLPDQGRTRNGRIDLFWPKWLLAEHKSAGQDLDAAHTQALDYFLGLDEAERPRYVVVSDFQRFRVYDLEENTDVELVLAELPARIAVFGFIAGYVSVKLRDEPEANIAAVQKLGELHDALKADGYGLDATGHAGHPLQVLLVRLLFCLFADDTGLFSPKDSFLELIENTRADGGDTGDMLAHLFQVLNQPLPERQKSTAEPTPRSPTSTASCSRKRCRFRNSIPPCARCCWNAASCSGPAFRRRFSAQCSRRSSSWTPRTVAASSARITPAKRISSN